MRFKFLGAVGTVTGSRTLLSYGDSKSGDQNTDQKTGQKTLVDCGLFQGPKSLRLFNWESFPYAHQVQNILLTHAHLDHVGAIPMFVRDGFRGQIYCTQGTLDLATIILKDSAHLQEEDAEYANRTKYSHHKPALPLYNSQDVERALKYFSVIERDEWIPLKGIDVRFRRSGHIVGSSYIEIHDKQSSKKIVFSGDLGSERSSILRPSIPLHEADVVVLESTYGNKILKDEDPRQEFTKIINEVIGRKGQVLIPAFSVGRTQEVLHVLSDLMATQKIAEVPIYLNSPMATRATEVYLNHPEDLNLAEKGSELISPICAGCFKVVESAAESEWLIQDKTPKIILSASGMLTGGRIMHHLKTILPNANNAVLFVGYQAAETKGRLLIDGIKELRIHHVPYPVRASVHSIRAMSSHADSDGLISWIRNLQRGATRVYLNHGEPDALFALKKRIETELNLQTVIPHLGEEFTFESN